MHSPILKVMLMTAAAAFLLQAHADTVQSDITTTEIKARSTHELEIEKAKLWGLGTVEWERFQQLMQGPLGVYSPNLDPLSALGIEAKTEQERTRYAELQVQMETVRFTKLLAYQNAYDQAYKRLYPDMLPVNLVGSETKPLASPASSRGRLAVFVTHDCKGCVEQVKQLQSDNQPFDIYLVGTRLNDDGIRAWALKAGISTDKVHSRQITLNHDAGRWISIGGKGPFPAVLREENGQWVRH
jgi:integrating conjugative element protein (TIGR03759 family)